MKSSNKESTIIELHTRLDYITEMEITMDNYLAQGNYGEAAECMSKIITQAKLCEIDMRYLSGV